jgi:predicted NAD/FAD-dependent oxidoreductase
MSTRRTKHGGIDHGAQYFTARDPRFLAEVNSWIAAGVTQEWAGQLAAIGLDGLVMIRGDNRRYVGTPRMSAVTRHLSAVCQPIVNFRATIIERRGNEWWLQGHRGKQLGPFTVAAAAVPAPQAVPLLAEAPALAAQAQTARMAGCWAVLLAFPERLKLPFAGAFVNTGRLSWIARNSSKPGRSDSETWILHASPDWSEAHIEESPEQVVTSLLVAFAEATRTQLPEPLMAIAHRWRHALPVTLLEQDCLFDRKLAIGACGDWCNGPRVEGAFLSGVALAERIMTWIASGRPTT